CPVAPESPVAAPAARIVSVCREGPRVETGGRKRANPPLSAAQPAYGLPGARLEAILRTRHPGARIMRG
ncbi:MAG: hypothetical protein OEU49_08755, partial [Chromatiales bacterium]|nr:hypothetical protein [Chromatiales bacterium]